MANKYGTMRVVKSNDENEETSSESKTPLTFSWPLIAVGVAAASGVGLIAASVIGVGEAALAGAAGYLAYRKMTDESESEPEGKATSRKRSRSA